MKGSRINRRRNRQRREFQQAQFDGVLTVAERARAEGEYRRRKGNNAASFSVGDLVRVNGSGEAYAILEVIRSYTVNDVPKYRLNSPHRQTFYESELRGVPQRQPRPACPHSATFLRQLNLFEE